MGSGNRPSRITSRPAPFDAAAASGEPGLRCPDEGFLPAPQVTPDSTTGAVGRLRAKGQHIALIVDGEVVASTTDSRLLGCVHAGFEYVAELVEGSDGPAIHYARSD